MAGTDDAILMVEAGANEIPEAEILDALDIAHSEIQKLCAAQRELAEKAGKEKLVIEPPVIDEEPACARSARATAPQLDAATQVEDKLERQDGDQGRRGGRPRAVLRRPRGRHLRRVPPEARSSPSTSSRSRSSASASPSTRSARTAAASARSATISIEVGVAPRTHGSALFTRGQTQALSVAALGTLKEEMRLDTLGLETQKFYWHHYNFPPFSVGEAGFMRGPKRRDIGHGALAERALVPVVPSTEDFPYTIRVVSDILESNGSSSMASVCGSSLALMDAGVPIRKPVAGIAMGLIKEGDDYTVLTDIAGVEDHLGDMDFKVAGTGDGHHRPADGHQDHGRHLRHPARRARPGPARRA